MAPQPGQQVGQGRLITKFSNCVDHVILQHLLCQKGQYRLVHCNLYQRDVQWDLVVQYHTSDQTIVKLANIVGSDKAQVCFSGRIDTMNSCGSTVVSATGTERIVDPDGCVGFCKGYDPYGGRYGYYEIHVTVRSTATEVQHGDELVYDLARLRSNGAISDVVLQVQSVQGSPIVNMRAHKAVLAARSPVFQTLFLSSMAETKTGTVIVDFPAAVMEILLEYAYTDRLDLPDEDSEAKVKTAEDGGKEGSRAVSALDLLAAADYYQMNGLKRLCEERLLRSVRDVPEECLHIMVLADRYGAHALKDAALGVAAANLSLLRPEWGNFVQQHHGLAAELMGVLADKQEQAKKV